MPHDNGVQNRFLVECELVLIKDRHALPGADDDFALIRFHLAGEDSKKGRFAGAVGPDEPIAVARGELYVDVFENDPLPINEGYVRCTDHAKLTPCEKIKNHRDSLRPKFNLSM